MNITVNEFILYSFIPFRKTRNKKSLGKKTPSPHWKKKGCSRRTYRREPGRKAANPLGKMYEQCFSMELKTIEKTL